MQELYLFYFDYNSKFNVMTDIIILLQNFLFGCAVDIGGVIYECDYAIAPWIIPLISAVVSAVSAGASAAKGAKQNRKNRQILNEREDENESIYLSEFYRGALDNKSSKAYLKKLDEKMEERNAAIDNKAISSGFTHENTLAAKQANNEVLSDAIAGLIEGEDNRKLNVQDRYFSNKAAIDDARMNNNAAVANNWANLGAGISSAAGSLASAYLMGDGMSSGNTGRDIRRFYQGKTGF